MEKRPGVDLANHFPQIEEVIDAYIVVGSKWMFEIWR